MADEGKPRFDIPWATLLPLLAALAGVVAQFRPLVSARPNTPSGKAIELTAVQDVDARLWQDPLTVAERAKEQLEADLLRSSVPSSRVERHMLPALIEHICQEAESGSVLVLAVMLDAGPYIEQEESRLRARQGVLEGLNESGFAPSDSEHIGFVTIPGELYPVWQKPADPPAEDGAILIPWEECIANRERVDPPGTKRVFVLWLPASSFGSRPLEALATKLVRPLRLPANQNLVIKLLGPANSTGLQAMTHEGPDGDATKPNPYEVLDGLEIISPRATASDEALLGRGHGVAEKIQGYIRDPRQGGIVFRRTVQTDDVVLERLIAELELRHVYVRPKNGSSEGDRVVVLTEWDNPYGRSLAKTFADKGGQPEDADDATPVPENGREPKKSIMLYRYMHGIDGRLPGDPAARADNTSAASGSAVPSEATEGVDRSDFLRRLARELKEEDTRLWREGKNGIRAIGLLGSDIFDKLMILRALRPEFPDAIFFTNNYDAHFERKDDWGDVRNLVIASPFGSTIAPIKASAVFGGHKLRPFHQKVAPFRDSNQTAMFFGTLVATGRFDDAAGGLTLAQQPRLFEIGRRGAQELYQETTKDGRAIGPVEHVHWFRDWLSNPGAVWPLAVSALALFLLAAWISLSIVDFRKKEVESSVDRPAPDHQGLLDRVKHVSSSTAFVLICGVPIIVVAVGWLAQCGHAIDEPLAFFSGISIWPTEMLRLVGLLLAVHFLFKARGELQRNERKITQHFFPGSAIADKWRIDLGLHRWQKEHPTWITGGAKVPAEMAWAAYLRRNRFWPRLIRISALTVLYLVFAAGVYLLFPNVVVPARGDAAFTADLCVLIPTVIATMVLTFYVVDAIRLSSNFIRILTGNETQWGATLGVAEGFVPPLAEHEFNRSYDIFFVARRTEVIAPLIWYPLIVLAISLVARSSIFDHWTWPLSLLLIFTLNAGWAFGSAIFLRRSAEQLRSAAIDNLQLLRLKRYRSPEKRQAADELLANVRGIHTGAFAPLFEQPFIRAIIYPSGGLGLIAVGQRLLEIF